MENGNGEAGYRPQAVWLYSDGVYRWIYEKDLYRNRFETDYVLKVMALVFGLSWVLMGGVMLAIGAGALPFAIVTAICLGGGLLTVGILRLGHLASARSGNGVEVIAFGMNDDGLSQIHYDDARKAEDAVERMLLTASATQGEDPMKAGGYGVTLFRDVRRMAPHPKDDLIDLTLKGNYKCRVYVGPEDFNFVKDYIQRRICGGQ